MYSSRNLTPIDLDVICSFPRNQEEMIFSFPRAVYPLTPDQILETIRNRLQPTVVLRDNQVVAFATLYDVKEFSCYLGNVIVSPGYRGRGAASYLLEVMEKVAKEEFSTSRLKLICQNTNTRGLIFYKKHGYSPVNLFSRQNESGDYVVGIEMEKLIGSS